MSAPRWRAIGDRPGPALEFLDTLLAEERTAGPPERTEGLEALRRGVQEGRIAGGVLCSADGRVLGLATWSVLRNVGRRVGPILLPAARRDAPTWTELLTLLLDGGDPAGPVVLVDSPMPGFSEAEAQGLLGPRGFHPFHRFALAHAPGAGSPSPPRPPLEEGRIRPITSAELEPLVELTAACYANSVDRFLFGEEPDLIAGARSLLRALFAGEYGPFVPEASFGLEIGGRVLGATLVTRRPAYTLLADVMVHPSLQGRGHARRLIRSTIGAMPPDPKSPLVLTVTRENAGAFHLYESLGFVVRQGPFTFWAHRAALGLTGTEGATGPTGDSPSATVPVGMPRPPDSPA